MKHLALILAGMAVLLTACQKNAEPAAPTELPSAKVRVQAIESKTRAATEEVMGTIRARQRAVLEAKVSGGIEKLPVVPGQSVKAGETLVELDAKEIKARLDQALTQREQLSRDTERLRQLLANNAVSRQEFESIESRYRVAKAAVTEAETMLAYTKIIAPFDGIITRKHAEVGDLAAPGKPLLEMEDPKSLRLEADVPEAAIGHIVSGAKLSVRVSGVTNDLTAIVSEIAPAADPNSRTFLVKLDLPANSGARMGQFGRLTVPLGETSALRVPASALIIRGQLELVFVAENTRAQMRLVKSGKRIGNEIEILSGLNRGDQIVIENAAGLRDGQPLEVIR
jgi:membrane fusion protein, multidrug efflux system